MTKKVYILGKKTVSQECEMILYFKVCEIDSLPTCGKLLSEKADVVKQGRLKTSNLGKVTPQKKDPCSRNNPTVQNRPKSGCQHMGGKVENEFQVEKETARRQGFDWFPARVVASSYSALRTSEGYM